MVESDLYERLESIDSRLARLESGFFGDQKIGHHGFVGRFEKIEAAALEAGALRQRIEKHADERADEVRTEARQARATLADNLSELQNEWSRFKAIAVGIGIGSGIVSAGSVFGILELLGRSQ